MVAFPVVCDIPDRHIVGNLGCEPVVEHLWVGPDQIAADKNVEDTSNERDLFPRGHGLGISPSCS